MASYCAFLRGVNVSGRSMKMAEVREVLAGAGMEEVSSVLASGNLVFQSDKPQAALRSLLEKALTDHYGEPVYLFVKSGAEVARIIAAQPFPEREALHVYAFICEAGFEARLLEEFGRISPMPDEAARLSEGYFYWQCPKGATLDAGFSKILGRRDMKEQFTSRNINTLRKVGAKMGLEAEG